MLLTRALLAPRQVAVSTRSLWFPPPNAHRSMHARHAARCALLALLLLARVLLHAFVYSPYCAPGAHPPREDRLRLMKHLQY
jgi:hypothetical protein